MYNNKQKHKKNPGVVETVLGDGAVFEGDVSCEGSMKVEGILKGNVKTTNTLVVGPNGSVSGDISAGEVIVFGEVNGKVDAGTLEIKSTGKITGEILIETLITDAGGAMMAKCEMKTAAKSDPDDQMLTVYSKEQAP